MVPWIKQNKIEIFGKYCEIHIPPETEYYDERKKDIILISHTMERGGAPLMLLELAKQYQSIYNVWVISRCDGSLKEQFIECNMPVAICTPVSLKRALDELGWDSFDMVWINTLLSVQYLMLFRDTNVRVYWWIHEPEPLFCSMRSYLPDFRNLSPNIKILPVSRLVSRYIEKYYGLSCKIIHMPIADVTKTMKIEETDEKAKKDKVLFFMPAKIQAIKAQDVLAYAILKMPEEYRDKALFIFAGAKDTQEPEFYELMVQLEGIFPNTISVLGEIERDEVFEIYQKVDCVVAPSRMDATPTTIVEAMMFKKICICSDSTGISLYMEDGKNGFIVKTEDADDLARKIMYVIDNINNLQMVRENGYNTYLENFETSRVWKRIEEVTA